MPGRNEPCHCGSGRKFKRCCHALVAILDTAERLLDQLSDHCRHEHPATYRAGLIAFHEGAPQRFGLAGPRPEEMRRAERWFLLDGVRPDDPPPLECLREQRPPGFAALARSRLRLLRLGDGAPPRTAVAAPGTGDASDLPASGVEATLHAGGQDERVLASSAAASEVEPGELVVARCVPLASGVTGLLSGVCAVAPEAEENVLALARSSAEGAHHGGRRALGADLARAAVNWPEERLHTAEGEEVEDHLLVIEVTDLAAAASRLAVHPRLVLIPESERDEPDVDSWTLLPATAPTRIAPPVIGGVRWELADDEELDLPPVARVDLDPFDERLWIFAATRSRMERAEQELRSLLGGLLGDTADRDTELPSRTPRWQALRWERMEHPWERRMAAVDHVRAA